VDVPELVIGEQKYTTDEEKATILMETFFPRPPMPEEPDGLEADGGRGRGSWGDAA
jgi:hypothetical protein